MLDELHTKKSGRSRAIQQRYDTHTQHMKEVYGAEIPCPFCSPLVSERRTIASTETMLVVENDFPYEFFDNREVSEHIMIVPRRHIGEYRDFSEEELQDYWRLIADYQSREYALFTRPVRDEMRSVPLHLHTHAVSYVQ